MEGRALVDIIHSYIVGLFNKSSQVWNHTFCWHCLSPVCGGSRSGALADEISDSFGSFDAFKAAFSTSAVTNFGSGWTWLVKNKAGKLEIINTSNAANPMTDGLKPLLTCDVWEHAYYIDYRNVRPVYLEAFWALVNWGFVSDNF